MLNITNKQLQYNFSINFSFYWYWNRYTTAWKRFCKDHFWTRISSLHAIIVKVVVVDGPIAAGKLAFAKELATELEMKYFPEATMDNYYVNSYGYDLRKLDPQLPPNVQNFNVNKFQQNPAHKNVATFQIRMLMQRYSQYIDALTHLFSTGEGVVLDRCVYSDFVFVEAMFKNGYISKGARSVYYDLVRNTFSELMKPHLVIYLDVPVNASKDLVKKRANPVEVGYMVLNDKYLQDMENIYKQLYLKVISTHAELLVLDWPNHGETEVVDWRMENEEEWTEARARYMNKSDLMNYFNVPRYDVPELIVTPKDFKARYDLW